MNWNLVNRLRDRLVLGAVALLVLTLASACGDEPSAAVPAATSTIEVVASATLEPVAAPQTHPITLLEPAVIPPSPLRSAKTRTASMAPVVAPTPTPATQPVAPTPTASPTAEPQTAPRPASPPLHALATLPPDMAALGQQPSAPDRDLYDLASRLRHVEEAPTSRIVATSSGPLEVGHQDVLFVTSLVDGRSRPVNATVQVVSEHAYWYVANDLDIRVQDLQWAAQIYEERVHPAVVGTFGDIWNPGVDGDPRLNILHANLSGAAGYYGSKDEFPRQVHPKSNEREIIYMDGRNLEPGSDRYMGILAHELQHATHWNQDLGEEAWVNEGLSEFAITLAGYRTQSPDSFLRRPQVQLNWWPDEIQSSFPHYGASALFFTYLSEHYGGPEGLGQLAREQLDGVAGVNAYLSQYGTTFTEVFRDWIVANYLDAATGPYGYPDTDVELQNVANISGRTLFKKIQPQFSAQYFDLTGLGETLTVSFQGSTSTLQIGDGCRGGARCLWGGKGDSIDSTLTRRFDLYGLTAATLEFDLWHDIERGWDYAYVEISENHGQTWDIVKGSHSTGYNPSGNAYGHGYTGSSGAWVDEFVDLTPYVGGEVLVRFEYVTDDAVYLDGLAIDNIAIPELGFMDDAESSAGWEAHGFIRIDGTLPQLFAVQLVEVFGDNTFQVTPMELDKNNVGELVITGLGGEVKQAALIVAPVTDGTRHPAAFDLNIFGS